MSARRRARKRALDVLFECEARGLPLGATLEQRRAAADSDPQAPPLQPYSVELVEGVAAHRDTIDEALARRSHGWDLDRMPAVDRNLLRIAAYELLWRDDVPDPVAISEAVELATELSTDESPGFVNGLLSALAADKDAARPSRGET